MSHARDNARLARTGIPTVASANDLRDLAVFSQDEPTAVQTLGALTVGDGGGGLWRWDSTSVAADNLGTVLLPTGSAGAGRWLRLVEGQRYNVLWFHDGSDDPGPALQACVDAACANPEDPNLAGQVGRTIYFPAKPGSNVGNPREQSYWYWGSTVVKFGDPSDNTEAALQLETDRPTYIRLTQNLTSLFQLGYVKKSRKQSIHDLHVDVASFALDNVIQIEDALYLDIKNIEVAASEGGTCKNVVRQEATGTTGAISTGHISGLYDSGGGAITESNFYAEGLNAVDISDMRGSPNANAIVHVKPTGASIQASKFGGFYGPAGETGLPSIIRLEADGADNIISENEFRDIFANASINQVVEQTAVNSGVIQRNVFNINETDARTAVGVFNQRDDHSLIRRNVYNGFSTNNGDPRVTGVWNGAGIESLIVRDTEVAAPAYPQVGQGLYVYVNGAWSTVLEDKNYSLSRYTVPRDTFVSIPLIDEYTIVEIIGRNSLVTNGAAVIRAASSTVDILSMWAGADFETTTGALTGTTGNDSKVTLSAAAQIEAHFENRRFAVLVINVIQRNAQ